MPYCSRADGWLLPKFSGVHEAEGQSVSWWCSSVEMKIWLAAAWAVSGALMALAPGCPPVLRSGFGGCCLGGLWVLWLEGY